MYKLLCVVLLLAGCSHVRHPVILISIDAYRADYLQRGLSPNLEALAAHGVRAQWMIPSFPSETYPNHYAMVTGLYPDHNGVVGNEMEIPADHLHATLTAREGTGLPEWFEQATPIWVTLHRAGGHSAVMLWPGSEAPHHDIRPDHWLPYDISITADTRVDRLLKWIDQSHPDLSLLYFDRVDYEAHLHGPDSPEVNDAIRQTDEALGRLLAGLKKRGQFDIIVVSDHGMASVTGTIYLDDYFDKSAHGVMVGGVGGVSPNPGQTLDARRLLAPHPHMQCWRKQDVPARFHYGTNDRIPEVVCLAQTGWIITTHAEDAKRGYREHGEHGYDPADPLMRSIFIAAGPDFRRGYVSPPFQNVDVYPLLAHLLDIEPKRNDGDYGVVANFLPSAH